MGSGVTQLIDDGWEENSQRANRQVDSVEAKAVEPDLRVLECLNYTVPSELFFSGGIAVSLESRDNVFPLLLGEELGSRGVTVDEEIRGDGDDNGQETLL